MSVSLKDTEQYKTLQLYPLWGCNYTNSFRSLNVPIIILLSISHQTCRLPGKRRELLGELNWNKNSMTACRAAELGSAAPSRAASVFTSTAGGCVQRISCCTILSVDLNPQRHRSLGLFLWYFSKTEITWQILLVFLFGRNLLTLVQFSSQSEFSSVAPFRSC